MFLPVPVGDRDSHFSALNLLVDNFGQVQVFRYGFREDDPQFFDPLLKLLQRAIHHELTGGEDSYPLGDSLYVAEDVRAEKNCSILLLDYFDGKFEELPARDGIEPERRVVENKQLGVNRHRQREVQLRPHTHGQIFDPSVFRQAECFHEMIEGLIVPLQRKVFAELDQPFDLIVLDEVVAFGDAADPAADFWCKVGRFGLQQESPAARRRFQTQQNPDNRCLAGTVSSQQAVDTASRHREIDAVQNAPAVEIFDKIFNFDNVIIHSIVLFLKAHLISQPRY